MTSLNDSKHTKLTIAIKETLARFIEEPTKENYQKFSQELGELGAIDSVQTNLVKENIDKALVASFTKDIEERASKLSAFKEAIFKDLDTI